MFVDFMYALRGHGIAVTATDWMTVCGALERGLAQDSLAGFYHLTRALVVKDEKRFDDFDAAFLAYFAGVEGRADIAAAVAEWLKNPKLPRALTDEEKAMLKALDSKELRDLFEQRLREQKGRHDGGNKWIGTGGTSPFGHGGYNPAGIRVGGEGVHNSAVQVASERRFENLRSDRVLDTRSIQQALKKLRVLSREGRKDVLDLDDTIDETCRDAGELHLVFHPERKNNVKLVLLMDVGGTMDPYAMLVSRLFSAAHRSSHFKDFQFYFFHNCPYEHLYTDISLWKGIRTLDLLRQVDETYMAIFVGDAFMYPGELTERYGAIDYYHRNDVPGIEWLRRLASHFAKVVWLNPRPQARWNNPSAQMILELVPMFELTLDGLDASIRHLIGKRT